MTEEARNDPRGERPCRRCGKPITGRPNKLFCCETCRSGYSHEHLPAKEVAEAALKGYTQVWSCGGGVQSAAIGALIATGKLPKPDLAFIIDVGREKSTTWTYFDSVLAPAMMRVGVEVHRVKTADYMDAELFEDETCLIPLYTNRGGRVAKLGTFCSGKWKGRVSREWARERGVENAQVWLGISTDEIRRVRPPQHYCWQHRYPLVFDLPVNRGDCVQIVTDAGWPEPPQTCCFMCPQQNDSRWCAMRRANGPDWASAVAADAEIRKTDPHLWIHKSCRPLPEVDFSLPLLDAMTGSCDSGYCFS